MGADLVMLPLHAIEALAAEETSPLHYSPLGDQPYLLFDGERDIASAKAAKLANWLRRLACPTLAVSRRDTVLSRAADVAIADVISAQPLVDGICHSPIAATVLVQLLRMTEQLPLIEALTAESLAYASLQSGPEFRRWLAGRRPPSALVQESGPAVEVERDREAVVLRLNRPVHHNAMSVEMRDALVEALELVLMDATIARVMLCGRGRCFSVGGELAEFATAPDGAVAHIIRSLALPARLLARCADRVTVRLHGACIGSGIEFPAFAAHLEASGDTFFQLPELRMGLIPGAGGCVGIGRRIGRQRLTEWVLSGQRIRPTQALRWGLIDAIEPQAR